MIYLYWLTIIKYKINYEKYKLSFKLNIQTFLEL